MCQNTGATYDPDLWCDTTDNFEADLDMIDKVIILCNNFSE